MKRDRAVVEFINSVSDEDLRFLALRLIEKMSGDMPDALNFLSRKQEVDLFLGSASSVEDFYKSCDTIKDWVVKEVKRRGLNIGIQL